MIMILIKLSQPDWTNYVLKSPSSDNQNLWVFIGTKPLSNTDSPNKKKRKIDETTSPAVLMLLFMYIISIHISMLTVTKLILRNWKMTILSN